MYVAAVRSVFLLGLRERVYSPKMDAVNRITPPPSQTPLICACRRCISMTTYVFVAGPWALAHHETFRSASAFGRVQVWLLGVPSVH